jgi:hypothetical protein
MSLFIHRGVPCKRGLGKQKERNGQVEKLKHNGDASILAHVAMIFKTKGVSRVNISESK